MHPESDTTRVIQSVYKLVTWIDTAIFIFVFALLAWAVWRYRERKGQENNIPKQVHGSVGLEMADHHPRPDPGVHRRAHVGRHFPQRESAAHHTLTINVTGHQWWWEFQISGTGAGDGQRAARAARQVDRRLRHLQGRDPLLLGAQLAGKADALPGKKNELWFTPEKVGMYYGQCAEYCGTSHANMRFNVFVDSPADFDAWVARTKQPQKPDNQDAKDGEALFAAKGCIACHTITGRPDAVGQIGPNLTNLHDRTMIASALVKQPAILQHWVRAPAGDQARRADDPAHCRERGRIQEAGRLSGEPHRCRSGCCGAAPARNRARLRPARIGKRSCSPTTAGSATPSPTWRTPRAPSAPTWPAS